MKTSFASLPRYLTAAGLCLLFACADSGSSSNRQPGPVDPDSGLPLPNPGPDPKQPVKPVPKAQSFESDLPGSVRAGQSADAGIASGAFAPGSESADASRSAERAIVEADIIQTAGNRLYALSRAAGLSVIDITDPSKLAIVGRYRELSGTPFEMYLRDGVALVMFSGWAQYNNVGDDRYEWVQTSKVVALDVANPAAIARLGSFDVAGDVSDSRIVGDVLYVVGYQNGYCWHCDQKPLTSVISLNVQNPRAIAKVDELKFEDTSTQSWGKRSISVNTQRMYVAGPEWGEQPTASTIQAIDISDPSGDLVPGATVRVDGQINNRWQMDEYQGVLRVVSQPFAWWGANMIVKPSVQTFTVVSSQQLTALGRAEINMPPGETLQSVRFDGARGYAITAIRSHDPLFTLDLSNPAQPRQVGELEMPGFVYHMEPRGDRLIGLGFDQGNPAGGIAVSLFDVSNMAAPRMLSRVNFGGRWASLPEDQDRIHKAFRVLDALGLLLVPFSGWEGWTDQNCSTPFRSGVKLIDFTRDTLTERGVAPSRGVARRAIVQGSHLLTVSDEAVDTFSIADRNSPQPTGQLTLARNVRKALPLTGDRVARINQDWYTNKSTLDIVASNNSERADLSLGELDLSEQLKDANSCVTNAYIGDAYVSGSQVIVTYTRWSYSYRNHTGVVVVDASTHTPRVAGRLEWEVGTDAEPWHAYGSYYQYGYYGSPVNTLQTGTALVIMEQRWHYTNNESWSTARLRIIDVRDPSKLTETTLALPDVDGYSGLVVDGNDVLFSHYEQTAEGRARFYLDRVVLSDPTKPTLAPKVNVPGALLHLDPVSKRAVMVELVRTVVEDVTSEECYARFAYADYEYFSNDTSRGTCAGYQQRLHLVRFVSDGAASVDSELLGEHDHISSSSLVDGRMAAVVSHSYNNFWYGEIAACWGPCGYGWSSTIDQTELLVAAGFAEDELIVGRATVRDNPNNPWWGWWGSRYVYVTKERAVVASLADVAVIDIADAATPKLLRTVPLYGYPQGMVGDGRSVLFALGEQGVQRIDL